MTRALLFTCLFAACASTPAAKTAPSAELGEYVPLKIGAEWTYDMKYPGQSGEMTVRLTGSKDGFVVDDKNGAYRLTSEGLRDRDRYLVRYPLEVGTQWKTVVGPSAVEHSQITSVGKPCDALAGRFDDCLVVHSWIRRDEQMTLHIEWTWAKGIGLVKLETEADISGKGRVPQVKQSLKRHALDGAPATPAAAPAPATPASPGDDGPGTWTKG